MASDVKSSPSKAMIVAGWIVSVLPCLMLLMSGVMKVTQNEQVSTGFEHLGFPMKLAVVLGIVELASTLIYLIPRTAVLGAILLTGYLGGAIATHARLLETEFIGPLLFGVLVWLGLFLRDPQVRALIPVRRN